MSDELEPQNQPPVFPERIGEDLEMWRKYHEVHGAEAYKYRRFYEEVSRQIANLYTYAEERGWELPDPDSGSGRS